MEDEDPQVHSHLLGGQLIGQTPFEERPPVPVWEYLRYASRTPAVSMASLQKVRFSLRATDGSIGVFSIDEMLADAPVPVPPAYEVEVADIVRLFEIMHLSGALEWDEEKREHVELVPTASYLPSAFESWSKELHATKE